MGIRENSNVVAKLQLSFRGQNNLILTAPPFGGGIDMKDPHEGRGCEVSSAFSFSYFCCT